MFVIVAISKVKRDSEHYLYSKKGLHLLPRTANVKLAQNLYKVTSIVTALSLFEKEYIVEHNSGLRKDKEPLESKK